MPTFTFMRSMNLYMECRLQELLVKSPVQNYQKETNTRRDDSAKELAKERKANDAISKYRKKKGHAWIVVLLYCAGKEFNSKIGSAAMMTMDGKTAMENLLEAIDMRITKTNRVQLTNELNNIRFMHRIINKWKWRSIPYRRK